MIAIDRRPIWPDFDMEEALLPNNLITLKFLTRVRIKDQFGIYRLSLVVSSCQGNSLNSGDPQRIKTQALKRFIRECHVSSHFKIPTEDLDFFPVDDDQRSEYDRLVHR